MICSNCGKENLEGSKFCEGCGTPLQAAPQPVQEPQPAPEPQPVVNAQPTPEYTPQAQGYAQPQENPYAQPNQGQPYGTPYGQQPVNNQPYGVPYGQQPNQAQGYGQPQNPQYGASQPPVKKVPNIDFKKIFDSVLEEVKGINKKTLYKAISMLLAFVTVATMMMGWMKISMGDEAEDQMPMDIDVSTTLNVFQFKHINGIAKDGIAEAIDDADSDDLPKEIKEARIKTNITALILLADMLVIALAILALAAYIFFSVIDSKNALYVGWASSALTVIAVIGYMIAFCVFNSILDMKIAIIKLEDFVSLRMTMGMLLTLASAVGNFVLMFLKKDEMKA